MFIMKTYTTKEVRKLTVDEFITGIDVTTLTNDVKAKYSDRYEEKFLSTANIISHILVFASCWISSLKMKTVTNYTPSSDDITVIFDTFEEYVLETICDSFEYDAAYSSKLHRLPSSKPLRTEAEASELYRLHKSEIDITAANIKNHILDEFAENAAICYKLQFLDKCIIQCLMYHTSNPEHDIKNYMYDEITVPCLSL